MFGIGMSEMLVIMVIGLVVIGPKQLPEVARTLGKLFAQFKRTTNQLKEEVDREVRQFTEMEEVKEFKRSMEEELTSIKSTAEDYVHEQVQAGEDAAKLAENTANELKTELTDAIESEGTDRIATGTEDSVQFASGKPSAAKADDGGLPPGKLPS